MKQIALRDFQLKAKEYLSELPIELVSHGKILAVVSSSDQDVDTLLTVVKENRKLLYSVVEYIEMAKERLRKSVNKLSTPSGKDIVTVDGNIAGATKGFHKCEGFKCPHAGILYKGKGRNDEGEVIRQLYLCDKHKKESEKAGEELEEV